MKARLLVLLGAVTVALALGELAARMALRSSPGSGFQDPQAWYREQLPLTRWGGGKWLSELVPHPYFGFVLSPEKSEANNYGFRDSRPFPHVKRSPRELVIAVLGGSVALGWASWVQEAGREEFVRALKSSAPALAGRDIVVLNMAMGGYKQPQQLHVASYFQPGVDLFVNLEGHNELEASSHLPLLPIEYPIGAYLQFQQGRQAADASKRLRWLGSFAHSLIERGMASPRLGSTGLYFSVAKVVAGWASQASAKEAEKAKAELRAALAEPRRAFYQHPPDREKHGPAAAVEVWERFVLQQHRMLAGSAAKALFLLQPNQHLPGSKPFTEWEQKHAIALDYARKAREYQLLPPAVKRLRQKGVNAHDLTMIFRETKETVYADNCCHLNDVGNRILSGEVARLIGTTVAR